MGFFKSISPFCFNSCSVRYVFTGINICWHALENLNRFNVTKMYHTKMKTEREM